MATFNTLIVDIPCSKCGNKMTGRVQFHFGETWQYEYHMGDTLKWDKNNIGHPGIRKVKVYGLLEELVCKVCGDKFSSDEFDIIIENDVITAIAPMVNIRDYDPTDGDYMIMED